MMWTYQCKYQSVQDHVRDAFTDKECVEIDTTPVFGWIRYVPLIMKWATDNCTSLSRQWLPKVGAAIYLPLEQDSNVDGNPVSE